MCKEIRALEISSTMVNSILPSQLPSINPGLCSILYKEIKGKLGYDSQATVTFVANKGINSDTILLYNAKILLLNYSPWDLIKILLAPSTTNPNNHLFQ